MIFLDAMKRQYLQYLRLAEKNLAASGVVVADNIISHSEKVQDYVAYVKKHYSSITLHVGAGLELSVKG